MTDLEKLKGLIDEENYPYFTDEYLNGRIAEIEIEYNVTLNSIAKELCLTKSNIEEIKLGDIIIPSPRNHFFMLASQFRANRTGTVVRADER